MKVVLLTGSNRRGATSTHLTQYIAQFITSKGHETTLFNLYEKPLPHYSPDNDYDDTTTIAELHQLMREAEAIVLATPEYHSSISGVLKNALDHLSKDFFNGKAVLSVSSSGGAVGTSSLQHLQGIVRNLHGINFPEWISIGSGQQELFYTPDAITDETEAAILDRVKRVTLQYLVFADKLSN